MEWIYDVLPYVAMILSALLSVINMVYTRKTGKSIDAEVSNLMKVRTPNYRQSMTVAEKVADGQTFSRFVKQYKLDPRTGALIELEPLDIQQLINSSADTALDRVLNRLMPDESNNQPTYADLTHVTEDLDFLSECNDVAETWRERLNLSPDMSISDVFQKMSEYEQTLTAQLTKKETSDNETKQTQTSNE
ncbi:hypothetical protein [Dipodfec virus UOA04_Rod_1094]|nr:hypothetical protein [Dipodfec virus UOA04_Rod_1094]